MTRIGFACNWDPDPRGTWSGTPWALWRALRRHGDVVDLGPHLRRSERAPLKVLYARRRDGRWSTTWKWSPTWDRIAARRIQRAADHGACDAVVQIQDLARTKQPYYLVQDLSIDSLLAYESVHGALPPGFEGIPRPLLLRRRERQHELYENAAGIFTLSEWLARHLVEESGIPPTRVHVLHPGPNIDVRQVETNRPAGRGRLLFIGRDFRRKNGPLVLQAFERVRREVRPDVTLTVAGPSVWPLPRSIPEGVDFVGDVDARRVGHLFSTHDLFVMPSHFEAFGIVFIEALAHGIPCIGRDAYAMKEIISDGINGALVQSETVDELASRIVQVLDSETIRRSTVEGADKVSARYSWANAAEKIFTVTSDR